MRNLENIPTEDENEKVKFEDTLSENIDFSEQLKEPTIEKKIETLKQEQSEQPEFKKEIEAVKKQEEEIKTQIKEREDRGILSSLSQRGRKFAGVALLSLSSFSAGCHKETSIPTTSELGILAHVKMIQAELPSEDKVITREGRFTRRERTTKNIERNKEYPIPGNSISSEYGFERDSKEDLGGIDEQTYNQKKQTNKQTERRVMENFRYFIKDSTVVSLKDGSFAVDIGARKGSDDRVAVGTGERSCYKVEPEDMVDMERIRREHFKKVDFALSKRPFIPTEVIEGIRKKTERSLKRSITYCEKIPQEQLPEEIKEFRAKEQEEFKNKKEKIMAKNKENKARREELEKNRVEKIGLEIKKEGIREAPKQKIERRTKEIR